MAWGYIRAHPLATFVVLAYALTWIPQGVALLIALDAGITLGNEENFALFGDVVRGLASPTEQVVFGLFMLGQVGPAIAGLTAAGIVGGRTGVREVFGRLAKWQVAPRWYLVLVLVPLGFAAASLAVAFLAGGFILGPFAPKLGWAMFLPFFLFMIVVTGFFEETGWRGFAQPYVQRTRNAYSASWVVGIIWGIWHVPFMLYFNRDALWAVPLALVGLTIGIVGWTIVNTWVYNSTRSVLLIALMHGWFNTVQFFLVMSQPNVAAYTVFTIVPWLLALVLIRRYGKEDLSARQRHVLATRSEASRHNEASA